MILTDGQTKHVTCIGEMLPIRDALEVVGSKRKVLILTSLMQGNRRFTEIQRSVAQLNLKVLAKELKDLEE